MGGKGLVRRWLAFNGVGALGIGLQLVVLALLVHRAGVPTLVATAIAVEAAVLHNFVWHQHWTWRDRPAGSRRGVAWRLARFHALNGAISMLGNLAIMAMLTPFRLEPVLANAIGIAVCAVANFAASEKFVFHTARTAAAVLLVMLVPLAQPAPIAAASSVDMVAELTPAAIAAWDRYERIVDERYQRATPGGDGYFAQDAFKTSPSWRQIVTSGQVSMARIESPSPGQGAIAIADGKVHHWVGAVFVPNARLDAVVNRIKDRAGRESEAFADVVASKLLARDGDRIRVYMKLKRDNIITVTYNTEHAVQYRTLGSVRASSRSVATKIAEIENAGTPREREKPVGNDHGFLWRLNAYWRFEQVDGGVIIECESVSLSRGVPTLLRPFVTGTVERIARESLLNTLVSLKKNLLAREAAAL